MTEVETLVREFCAGLDASQSAIDPCDARHGREVVAPLVVGPAPPRPSLRPVLVAGAAFAAVLLFGTAVWLVGLGDGDTLIAEDPTVVTPGPVLDGAPGLLDATWTLETSVDGWLRPVTFANGFAAIRFTDPMSEVFAETEDDSPPESGDIWISANGLDWAPAPEQPPEQPWSLSSDSETLFAEAGDVFDGTGWIWASTDGSEWRPALAPGEYGRLFESQADAGGRQFISGTVIAGPPGTVVFGVDTDGSVAGWVFEGGRFVLADLGTIEGLRSSDGWFAVAPLHDRFVLVTVDLTTYESPQHMKVSYSETGAVWSDLEPKPAEGPLAPPETRFAGFASDEAVTIVSVGGGIGLWSTVDGIRWSEIALRPSSNHWEPEVAHGGLGWLVFSPPRSNDGHTAAPDAMNLGLWLSADGATWSDLDDIGPLGAGLPHAFLVRDDHALVVLGADRGPERGWGVPGDPVTEIWRLDVAPATASR